MMQKYTRVVLIYGVPSVADGSVYDGFSELPCMPMFNKHIVTNNVNKQVSSTKKRVYRLFINKFN